jgi:hypothetical protein
MPMMDRQPGAGELMGMHIEAMYKHDERARICSINDWRGGRCPRLYFARTVSGNCWRFRHDLGNELTDALQRLCEGEPVVMDLAAPPVYQADYLRLLGLHAPIESVWSGPAFWITSPGCGEAVSIDASNSDLLRGGLAAWIPDVPHQRPFMASVVGDRAVSVCASVRITGRAHAAGVETLPEYRRQGFARDAVAGWARAVGGLEAMPLYSTSWSNRASRGLAASLGLSMFGSEFHVT